MKRKKKIQERIAPPEQYYERNSYAGGSDSDSVYLQKSPVFTVCEIKELARREFWLRASIQTIADVVVTYPLIANI